VGKGGACGALLLTALFLAVPAAPSSTSSPEHALLTQINAVRSARGLPTLYLDPRLGRAAESHARTQLAQGRIEHGPLLARLRSFGVRAPLVGENVAWGVGAVRAGQVLARWLASPGHRENLLRPGFRAAGVGTAFGPFAGHHRAHLVTVDFAGS
jgi:uncharacterized protein YkwD